MEALRVEAEGDLMLAGGDDDGAQDIVGTQDGGGLTVDGALPAGIVDVGEDGEALAFAARPLLLGEHRRGSTF